MGAAGAVGAVGQMAEAPSMALRPTPTLSPAIMLERPISTFGGSRVLELRLVRYLCRSAVEPHKALAAANNASRGNRHSPYLKQTHGPYPDRVETSTQPRSRSVAIG